MSTDADYVCTLDRDSLKKAKDELNENPEDRLAAIQAFREWIESQPHINSPENDTATLLRFLRGAKFSQLKARQKYEEHLLLKVKAPEWFKDMDAYDPKIKACIDSGYVVLLPDRSPDGCAIVIYRLAKLHDLMGAQKLKFIDLIKFGNIFFHYAVLPEMTQVNGLLFFVDFTGMTAGLLTKMMTPDSGKFHKMIQKAMVGRFKGFHDYNAGLFFDTMMAFYKPFMPKKWMERLKLHDTMESVYRYIPMKCLPIEYLPDEYTGPNAGHIDDIAKNTANALSEKSLRDDILYRSSKAFWLDESKRPTEVVTQHFRKLNVD